MASTSDTEIKEAKRPVLLKGTSQAVCVQLKIGDLGLELWNFPNEEQQPYARLHFEPPGDRTVKQEEDDQRQRGSVTINWHEGFAIAGAIQEWVCSLDSGIEEYREPLLHLELGVLTFDFYRSDVKIGKKMACHFMSVYGLSKQVTLTRLEATLLGRLLYCLGDDQEEQQQ